jgi:hypothetical protein
MRRVDAMTSGQRVADKQNGVRAFLTTAASGCGDWLNSVLVALGDKVGLYKTGQYSSEKR